MIPSGFDEASVHWIYMDGLIRKPNGLSLKKSQGAALHGGFATPWICAELEPVEPTVGSKRNDSAGPAAEAPSSSAGAG